MHRELEHLVGEGVVELMGQGHERRGIEPAGRPGLANHQLAGLRLVEAEHLLAEGLARELLQVRSPGQRSQGGEDAPVLGGSFGRDLLVELAQDSLAELVRGRYLGSGTRLKRSSRSCSTMADTSRSC